MCSCLLLSASVRSHNDFIRHEVHSLLVAYTVDLIKVLRELFDIALQPGIALTTTWKELQEAFEAYERSPSRERIHQIICSKVPQGKQIISADGLDEEGSSIT